MKKLILLSFLLLSVSSFLQAQCNPYFPIKNGGEWVYENFNGKGKTTGKNQQRVTAFTSSASGFKATIHTIMLDEKGKELTNGDLEVTCEQGVILMDMRRFIPQEQMKAFGASEIKVESANLEFPATLKAGQTLKDGSITVTAIGSQIPMSMVVTIFERVVEAQESITTPAGTFECFKIRSKMHLKNQMGIVMNFDFSSVEWLASDGGNIKSESYNKNGKLQGSTVLISRK